MGPRPLRVLLPALLGAAVLLPQRAQLVLATTGEEAPGVHLHLPAAYLLLAPLSSTMDYLTMATPRRHLLVLSLILVAYAAWRIYRLVVGPGRAPLRFVLTEGRNLLLLVLGLTGFYAYGVLGPRPMARLVADDPDLVAIDFHSHTLASHDGRPGFTAARERAWHSAAGFDVVYITDHDSIRPAVEAAADNPGLAGGGLVVLPGREVVFRDEHVVVLGTADPRADFGGDSQARAGEGCGGLPVMIHPIPDELSRVPTPLCSDGTGGVVAIELVDGAPRGLAQGSRDRGRILALADSLGLAVVVSTNLHGWGRTAPGWSLMRVPGWREMTPARLSGRIESDLRTGGTTAVVPVVRRVVASRERSSGPLAAVALPVEALFSLSRAERLGWLLWGCLFYVVWKRRRAGRPSNDPTGSGV